MHLMLCSPYYICDYPILDLVDRNAIDATILPMQIHKHPPSDINTQVLIK